MKYYSVKDLSEELGFTRQTILNWIKNGKLEAIKVMRDYRIPEEEVDKIKKYKIN